MSYYIAQYLIKPSGSWSTPNCIPATIACTRYNYVILLHYEAKLSLSSSAMVLDTQPSNSHPTSQFSGVSVSLLPLPPIHTCLQFPFPFLQPIISYSLDLEDDFLSYCLETLSPPSFGRFSVNLVPEALTSSALSTMPPHHHLWTPFPILPTHFLSADTNWFSLQASPSLHWLLYRKPTLIASGFFLPISPGRFPDGRLLCVRDSSYYARPKTRHLECM